LKDIAAWRHADKEKIQKERKCREDMAMKKVAEYGNDHSNEYWENHTEDLAETCGHKLSSRNEEPWAQYDQATARSQYPHHASHYNGYFGHPYAIYSGMESRPYPNHYYYPLVSSRQHDRPMESSYHEGGLGYHSDIVVYPHESAYAAGVPPFRQEILLQDTYSNDGHYQGNSK
jgi:hypothetical protein